MQMICQFSSEQEHFTHGMFITALICPSDVKKSNRSCTMNSLALEGKPSELLWSDFGRKNHPLQAFLIVGFIIHCTLLFGAKMQQFRLPPVWISQTVILSSSTRHQWSCDENKISKTWPKYRNWAISAVLRKLNLPLFWLKTWFQI